jgi:two-component sensor histidine kinase/PAS domain-containing protein
MIKEKYSSLQGKTRIAMYIHDTRIIFPYGSCEKMALPLPGKPAIYRDSHPMPGRVYAYMRQNFVLFILLVIVIAILYAVSRYNFALFHTSIEFCTIAVAAAIFLLVWKSRHIVQNNYLLFIGVTFLFIAILDFLHTTVYQGVGIFPDGGGALSTRLWIAARYLQAVTLLAAPLVIRRKVRMDLVAVIYLAADIIIVASIFIFKDFPATYIEGVGLTPFKILSEYIICAMLAGAIILLYRNRESFDRQVLDNLIIAIVLMIISELAFTEYASFVDIFSVIGHVIRLFAYYFFYRAIIEVGQEKPYNLLYRDLNESEKRFRALYASMTEGVAVHDIIPDETGSATDYRITEVNPAFSAITGIPADKAVGAHGSILYGAGKPPYLDVFARVAETGIAEEFSTVFAPMGKTFRISVFSPSKGKFATVFSDITDQVRDEEALHKSRDELELRVLERTAALKSAMDAIGMERHRLYDVLETLPVYVCLLDKDYRMPFANKYFRETFGYSDTRCCHDFLFNLKKPCDTCETYTAMNTKAPHHWYWTGPNGRNYDIYDFPFYDEKGALLILEMGIDITEQKKAESALIKSRDELEIRVEERTADLARKNLELFAANEQLAAINEELNATQEELQQNIDELGKSEQVLRQNEGELKEALAEKEVLLAEIHHRVKNNLTAFISLLSLEGTYESTPEAQNLRKDLQNRARSMALIHETLYRTRKYSSVDMGMYMNTLICQVAASYASGKHISILVEADGVMIDLARATPCGLIVNELVTNSFKYAFPDSFDCLKERKEPCTIRISLKKEDGFYVLKAGDNGVGLPAGIDLMTTKSLGLKLVHFLARHQLRAKTEINRRNGSEFIFRFPESTTSSGGS